MKGETILKTVLFVVALLLFLLFYLPSNKTIANFIQSMLPLSLIVFYFSLIRELEIEARKSKMFLALVVAAMLLGLAKYFFIPKFSPNPSAVWDWWFFGRFSNATYPGVTQIIPTDMISSFHSSFISPTTTLHSMLFSFSGLGTRRSLNLAVAVSATLLSLLLYLTAKRIFGEKEALLAFIIAALDPSLTILSATDEYNVITALALTGMVYFITKHARRPGLDSAVAATSAFFLLMGASPAMKLAAPILFILAFKLEAGFITKYEKWWLAGLVAVAVLYIIPFIQEYKEIGYLLSISKVIGNIKNIMTTVLYNFSIRRTVLLLPLAFLLSGSWREAKTPIALMLVIAFLLTLVDDGGILRGQLSNLVLLIPFSIILESFFISGLLSDKRVFSLAALGIYVVDFIIPYMFYLGALSHPSALVGAFDPAAISSLSYPFRISEMLSSLPNDCPIIGIGPFTPVADIGAGRKYLILSKSGLENISKVIESLGCAYIVSNPYFEWEGTNPYEFDATIRKNIKSIKHKVLIDEEVSGYPLLVVKTYGESGNQSQSSYIS